MEMPVHTAWDGQHCGSYWKVEHEMFLIQDRHAAGGGAGITSTCSPITFRLWSSARKCFAGHLRSLNHSHFGSDLWRGIPVLRSVLISEGMENKIGPLIHTHAYKFPGLWQNKCEDVTASEGRYTMLRGTKVILSQYFSLHLQFPQTTWNYFFQSRLDQLSYLFGLCWTFLSALPVDTQVKVDHHKFASQMLGRLSHICAKCTKNRTDKTPVWNYYP